MTNSRQNTLIVTGILVLAGGTLAGIIFGKDLEGKVTDALTNDFTLIVGGLIGFLSRGNQPNPEPKPEEQIDKVTK